MQMQSNKEEDVMRALVSILAVTGLLATAPGYADSGADVVKAKG